MGKQHITVITCKAMQKCRGKGWTLDDHVGNKFSFSCSRRWFLSNGYALAEWEKRCSYSHLLCVITQTYVQARFGNMQNKHSCSKQSAASPTRPGFSFFAEYNLPKPFNTLPAYPVIVAIVYGKFLFIPRRFFSVLSLTPSGFDKDRIALARLFLGIFKQKKNERITMEGRRWADNGMENNMFITNLANCNGKLEKSASPKGSPLILLALWLIRKLINSQEKSYNLATNLWLSNCLRFLLQYLNWLTPRRKPNSRP